MKTKEQELKEALEQIKALVKNVEGKIEALKIEALKIEKEDKFADLKEAHKNGAVIEYFNLLTNEWTVVQGVPHWFNDTQYRIKPEERPKAGDVVKAWYNDSPNEFLIKIADAEDLTIFPNIKTITKQEAIELLFGKEADND